MEPAGRLCESFQNNNLRLPLGVLIHATGGYRHTIDLEGAMLR